MAWYLSLGDSMFVSSRTNYVLHCVINLRLLDLDAVVLVEVVWVVRA